MFGHQRHYFDSALSSLLLAVLALHYAGVFSAFDEYILIGAALLGAAPVVWGAIRAARMREWASMDMLASIALIFSLLAAEWASAVFIALMLAAARILGSLAQGRMEKGITGLLKLRPDVAKVERAGKLEMVPLENVQVGDIVIADLGERIPVDGAVLSGTATADESSLTGESLPIEKTVGSKVYSSTLISSGNVRIMTERVGKDTTLERIIALVESARAEKPKTQTLGEKFGKIYVIGIFIFAAVLFAFTRNLLLVLAVVLVVCADDVAIAIPIAYLRGIGTAARQGVIIKGARHLETLGKADIIVFDKTRTLTKGKLSVSAILPASNHTVREVLEAGSLAAQRSKHPLSNAVAAYAAVQGIVAAEADSVEEVSGNGIIAHKGALTVMIGRGSFFEHQGFPIPSELQAQDIELSKNGQSVSYIVRNSVVIGLAAVSDEIKHDARAAIERLKKLGVAKIIMLTGDNEHVARNVAGKLGIPDFYAGLLPEEKLAKIRELHREGIVVMVGDGVNDAAALSASQVGIAMGAMGVDGAIESAEIVLMNDDLLTIPKTMELARSVTRVSIEDFWLWGITNAAGLALVFSGVIGPSGAAAYNFISDFFPLLNSLRVRTHS